MAGRLAEAWPVVDLFRAQRAGVRALTARQQSEVLGAPRQVNLEPAAAQPGSHTIDRHGERILVAPSTCAVRNRAAVGV